MKRALQLLIFGGIVGPLVGTAAPFPPEGLLVTVFVTTARQDCPLQVKAFKLPERVGDPPKVLVHNGARKQIRDFTLEALIGSGEVEPGKEAGKIGWISSTSKPTLISRWPLERNLPPEGDGEAHDSVLASHNLVSPSSRLRSNCVHVAVIVNSIEFQDGATWHLDSGQREAIWENSLRAGNSASCDKSTRAQEALDRLESGAGYYKSLGTPTYATPEPVQFYTVSCPVQQIDQKLRPMCPM